MEDPARLAAAGAEEAEAERQGGQGQEVVLRVQDVLPLPLHDQEDVSTNWLQWSFYCSFIESLHQTSFILLVTFT